MRKEFHNVLSSDQLLTDKRPARDYKQETIIENRVGIYSKKNKK